MHYPCGSFLLLLPDLLLAPSVMIHKGRVASRKRVDNLDVFLVFGFTGHDHEPNARFLIRILADKMKEADRILPSAIMAPDLIGRLERLLQTRVVEPVFVRRDIVRAPAFIELGEDRLIVSPGIRQAIQFVVELIREFI